MEITEQLYVKNRKSWRKWLERNHNKKKEIWLTFYKKHTNKESIPYIDVLKEALCFGWIDGTVKRIDENIYVQRFTPRRPKSQWSTTNVKYYEELLKEGLVTEAGKGAFENKLSVYNPVLGKNAAKWHMENKLGRSASINKRIKWHKEHQKHCGCRPIPKSLLKYLKISVKGLYKDTT